jgi:ABC-type multidrug transport system fused ATPase/permease subunit
MEKPSAAPTVPATNREGTASFVGIVTRCLEILPSRLRRRWLGLVPLLLLQAAVEWGAAASIYLFLAGDRVPGWRGLIPRGTSPALLLASLLLLKNGLIVITARLEAHLLADSMQTTFERLLRGYLGASLATRSTHHAAELSYTATDAIDLAFRKVLTPAASFFTEVFVVGALLAAIVSRAAVAGMLAIAILGAALGATLRATQRAVAGAGRRRDALQARLLRDLGDVLRGAAEIQALGREETVARGILARYDIYVASHRTLAAVGALSRPAVELVFAAGLLVASLAYPAAARASLVPLLGLIAYAAFRIIPAANRAVFFVNEVRASAPAVERIRRDLDRFPAPVPPVGTGSLALEPFRDRLALENVTVRPDGTRAPALDGVSLEVRRGEMLAVVGPTGAGKSTLLLVLAGLRAPDAGRVLLDGAPVLAARRQRVAWVPQSPFLSDDTLRRNVAFGLADDEIDGARVAAAIEASSLGEFVRGLPEGLETRAGEAGALLSGGERQRLAVARALYADPEILLLDEPTSALDVATERELMDTLAALTPARTIVVVSHRPAAVERADRIVHLERGRVTGSGKPGEFLGGRELPG